MDFKLAELCLTRRVEDVMGSAGSLILLVSVDAATLFLSGLLLYRFFGISFVFQKKIDIARITKTLP